MKTLRKIMMALLAIAMVGMTTACQKSENTDDGHGDINASIVGNWTVKQLYWNNTTIPGDSLHMAIIMNENGTGELQSNGMSLPIAQTHFTWALNGTTLNININNGGATETLSYTVTKLTATECVIQGTVVPGMPNMTGEVRVDMTREAAPDPDPEPEPDPSHYSELLPGTWNLDGLTYNGQNMSAMLPNIQLIFNANGTGVMSDNGETENNEFSWVISNNSSNISITVHNGQQYTFTIVSLTATEASFSGSNFEMAGLQFTQETVLHMTKSNGDDPNPPTPPDPANFPGGTNWVYNYNTTITEGGYTINVSINSNLNFNATGNGGNMQMNIVGSMAGVPLLNDTENIIFTYTYDATTMTGTMTGAVQGSDPETIPFTYDNTDNTIHIAVEDVPLSEDLTGQIPDGYELPTELVFTQVQ